MAAGAKEETEGESDPLASTCVYDRVTGKRIFRKTQSKNDEKGKAWASSRSVSAIYYSVTIILISINVYSV